MIDKFSKEKRLKRQIKDLNAERLHKNLLVKNLQQQIDQLKAQLNNMEACYIEKKQECENLLSLNQGHELRHQQNIAIKKNLIKRISG